jgi:hypothetical protein
MADDERSDAELAELLAELQTTLEDVQSSVGSDRQIPRTTELLRYTESYTIPTLIAALEAAVRALELLQATLRLVDGRPPVQSNRTRQGEPTTGVGSVGRATVERVDAALSELTDAVEGEPPAQEARDLLTEARALREEIDKRLGTPRRRTGNDGQDTSLAPPEPTDVGPHEIPVTAEGDNPVTAQDNKDANSAEVDVDAELESIRDEVNAERDQSDDWAPDS